MRTQSRMRCLNHSAYLAVQCTYVPETSNNRHIKAIRGADAPLIALVRDDDLRATEL